ncbi:MAG: asparagine synthase C-terminal domain-containing protein [Pseudomonadota bacterium]
MFRYIALAWSTANQAGAETARLFAQRLQVHPDWQAVLSRPGLSVFCTGIKADINTSYLLPPDHGVVLGKLFRRRALERPARPISLTADEAAHVLKNHGRALIDEFWGRYVALLYDAVTGSTRILRDPTGALPCYLIQYRGVCVIFSWLEDVLTLSPGLPELLVDWDFLAAHLLAGALPGRRTAISGVREILGGEAVDICGDTIASTLLWSAVEFARAPIHDERVQAADALRRTVRGCALSWASSYGNIMLRLSGGVDSSILASCLAADSTSARVTCINYHSAGSDSDEREYARLAAARAQRELIERERDPSFRLESILNVARTPNPSNYIGRMDATRMDAVLAASHGANAVFTGAGGDQLFFQYSTFWPAADYLRLRGLNAGFLWAAMDAARLGRVSVWKALRFAVSDRLRLRPVDVQPEVGEHLALISREALAAVRGQRRFLHPGLEAVSDVPVSKLKQVRDLMHPVGYYDPFDLEAFVERVQPLLSQPVVELCLRLPTYLLTNGGRGRALARQAFAADLPSEIARRHSKGGMEEHVKAILLRNLDFARSLLLDGALVGKGLLDRAKVEEVLSGRPTAIASYMGEIHTCLGIEAWLNRWSSGRQTAPAQT